MAINEGALKMLEESISGSSGMEEMLQQSIQDTHAQDIISSKLSVAGDVKEEDVKQGLNAFQKMWYYNNDIYKGFSLGHAKAVESIGKFIFDIAGVDENDNARKMLSNFMGQAEQELAPQSVAGNISDVVGQVATGMAFTGGFNPTGAISKTGMALEGVLQGGIIDGLFFDEKSGNIFDFMKDLGADNAVVEYLSSKDDEDALKARLKNSLVGMGIGGIAESIFALATTGKALTKAKNTVEGIDETKQVAKTPEQLVEETYAITKEEAKKAKETIPIEDRVARIEGEQPRVTRMSGEDLMKRAEDIINDVKASTQTIENPPINPKHGEGSNMSVFLKAMEGLTKDVEYRTQEKALELGKKALKEAMDDPNFKADDLIAEIADQARYQDVKTGVAKMTLALATKGLQESATKAKINPSSVADLLELTRNLEIFNKVSTHFVNYKGEIGRSLAMFNKSSGEDHIINFYKVLDTVDTDQSYKLFKKALEDGKIDQSVIDNIYNISNKAGKMGDMIDNYKDGWFTKVMNVLSEHTIGHMLTGLNTMLPVSIFGNAMMKMIDIGIDVNRYVFSNIMRTESRMQTREAKALLASHTYQTWYDVKATSKLLGEWADSKYADEVFDKGVLIRMYQDQPTHHKYLSSEYIRGEKGAADSTLNTMINTYGKVTRGSFKVMGVTDDIVKRGTFRAELIRQASIIADLRKIPDAEFGQFVDSFVRVNTEVQLIKNNGMRPSPKFLNENSNFMGSNTGWSKYADLAVKRANYIALQEEIGGATGKFVDGLNTNGLLRMLYPFKTITINSLDMASETTLPILHKRFWDDMMSGGVKRDTAVAKLAMAGQIIYGAFFLVNSGMISGTFVDPKDQEAYKNAGIPPRSFTLDSGKTWHDYSSLEPFSTILSVVSDAHNMYGRYQNRKQFTPESEFDSLMKTTMQELLMATASNIAEKTFAKNLKEQLDIVYGKSDPTKFAGNVASSMLPFSGISKSVSRIFGDGKAYEPSTFTERLLKPYKAILEREALDAFGLPVDDVKFSPLLTKKTDTEDPKYDSRREMVRLGVSPMWDMKGLSVSGVDIKLNHDEQYMATKLLSHPNIDYQGNIDQVVNSDVYKGASDTERAMMLQKAKDLVTQNATMMLKSNLVDRIQEKADIKIQQMNVESKPSGYDSIMKGIVSGK